MIAHAGTGAHVVDAVVRLLESCGKVGVPIADVTGFALNRLQYALFSEAARRRSTTDREQRAGRRGTPSVSIGKPRRKP